MSLENSEEQEDIYEDLPSPPEYIPEWATKEAHEWHRLSEFDILAKAEEMTGLSLDIKYETLPPGVWGIHVVRGDRGRIYVNAMLSLMWRRFAIFHEIYHLPTHTRVARFWIRTFESMESFENRADTFAWAALWPEWAEGDYADWS